MQALLRRLLAAWDADDPAVLEPIFDQLAPLVPSTELAVLRYAAERFDFRVGETATRALATTLNLPLGD